MAYLIPPQLKAESAVSERWVQVHIYMCYLQIVGVECEKAIYFSQKLQRMPVLAVCRFAPGAEPLRVQGDEVVHEMKKRVCK